MGAKLETREGRVGVQFGERTGFVLEPRSQLELVSFDDTAVELRVEGALSVELTKRQATQRLAVLAGSRVVEVRGTHFRVAQQGGALDVAVARGRVAVIEANDSVEVPAGKRLTLAFGQSVGSLLPHSLSGMDSEELAEAMRVPLVPGWTDAATARAGFAVVDVSARPGTRVKIDGMSVGAGTLRVRTVPGRHLVETGAVARWIELDAGSQARRELPVDNPRSERPAQLDGELQKFSRLIESCGNRVRKYDPTFEGDVEVEIGINADGTVDSVSPVVGLPDRDIEACVLDVLRNGLTFPRGSRHVVVKKISF